MQSFKINNQKQFTKALFIDNIFDNYYLVEGHINTNVSFSVSGKNNADFFDNDERDNITEYAAWSQLKPLFFQMIKGKKLPLGFRFVLMPDFPPTEISCTDNYYANIKYDGLSINITTGYSSKAFSLDKAPALAWDNIFKEFLLKNNIDFDIC